MPAFALVVTACLLSCAGTARAAGCHVPERPVLAQTLSWDRWQKAHETHASHGVMPASPAVVPLPCQGEIPTLPSVASVPMAAAPTPATRHELPLPLKGGCPLKLLPGFHLPSHSDSIDLRVRTAPLGELIRADPAHAGRPVHPVPWRWRHCLVMRTPFSGALRALVLILAVSVSGSGGCEPGHSSPEGGADAHAPELVAARRAFPLDGPRHAAGRMVGAGWLVAGRLPDAARHRVVRPPRSPSRWPTGSRTFPGCRSRSGRPRTSAD